MKIKYGIQIQQVVLNIYKHKYVGPDLLTKYTYLTNTFIALILFVTMNFQRN